MIEPNYIIALISFYLVMYITPGPNNAMILASGIKFGFKRTIPVILGITIGHNFQLLLVCSGFGKVFKMFPELQLVLKILCAAYLVYLSYQILGSFNKIKNKNVKPIKFYQAALFQILNPKAWSISSMAASGFIIGEKSLVFSISYIVFVAFLVCPIAITPWAAFGSIIKTFIKNSLIKTVIEYLLAFLLFLTAVYFIVQ